MTRVTELFDIQYPIVQAGMVWCSGWKLAASAANAGGLGVIGAGSMCPKELEENIIKCRLNTVKSFGVNLPLLYSEIEKHIDIIVNLGVKFVITSAGSPKKWTKYLQDNGVKVGHVVSSVKFAQKVEDAGCDFVIAEGFEAGGHNGKEETTTLCLVPDVVNHVRIPVIAAGGIATGQAMCAVMALGAEGVQIGTRFVASKESSAHNLFKHLVTSLTEGSTLLTLKELTPVRLVKNKFYKELQSAYINNASIEELKSILGKGRSKLGMQNGDLEKGELEIGQVSALVNDIKSAQFIIDDIMKEFNQTRERLSKL